MAFDVVLLSGLPFYVSASASSAYINLMIGVQDHSPTHTCTL